MFVTDLDNTLVGNDAALLELNQNLGQHRKKYETKIVYATGRSLFLYQQLKREKNF
ncbi:Sucrose-phosphate phosphatase [Richelia intracellularis HH01]|uniref:Sucrose-phosphate phosphatase n=1 Tax=Richelia intracellularis HH01 TaxID=1165094 RepID=M1WXQ2_9NOST|nr:Sucrose-phosphate phosphatase [Richelia intracellularis HH01]